MNGHDRNEPRSFGRRLAGPSRPFTTIELSGRLSAVAFVQGFILAVHLLPEQRAMQQRSFDPSSAFVLGGLESLLKRRHGLLDGVLSGGEPLPRSWLSRPVRSREGDGSRVSLHTGRRPLPAEARRVLPNLSWVGSTSRRCPPTAHWAKVTGVESAQQCPQLQRTLPFKRFASTRRRASRLLQRNAASGGTGRLSSRRAT